MFLGMSSTGTSAARVVRNTLANGLGGVLGMGVGILLTPYMIAQLGLAAYGVWTLALTLTFAGGYAALADLGIEAATARYVAEAISDGDEEALNRTVATTLTFFIALGLVLGLAMVVLAHSLTGLFSVSQGLRDSATICFALVGGQIALELPSRAFVAVLEGTQQFVTYQTVEVTRAVLQAILWVGALAAGYGLAALGLGLAITTGLCLALYWRLAHRAVPALRASPRRASRAEFKRLVTYGGAVTGLRFAGTLYRQMDKIILGIALTPSAVALFEIANKIHLSASMVQSMSVSALLPATATSRREPELLRDIFLRGTCYTVAASLPFVIAIFAFAEPLIRDWIGSEADGAAGPARLFLVYLLLNVFHNVGSVMVVALGRLRTMVIATLANVFINLGVSIALVGPLDIYGVIIGTLVGNAVIWPIYLRLYLGTFEVGVGQWLRRIVVPNLPGLLIQGALLAALLLLSVGSASLPVVGAAVLASVAASLVGFLRFGLPAKERAVLLATLRSAVRQTPTPAPAG